MKKLLAVAGIGLVGYLVVKKLRNKNEEAEVNEVEENIDNEIEIVDNDEEKIVPENFVKEELVDEIVDSLNNIKENNDYMDKIHKVCDEIFDTNSEEFDKLFKDLDDLE